MPPARQGWPSIWGRRLPDGSRGRPEGWAAHLSPDGLPRRVTPSYLALLRVELARFTPAGAPSRHRHCGAGPRLTADGSYPLPCAASSDFPHATAGRPTTRDHPTASLTAGLYRPSSTRSERGWARTRSRPRSRPGTRSSPHRPGDHGQLQRVHAQTSQTSVGTYTCGGAAGPPRQQTAVSGSPMRSRCRPDGPARPGQLRPRGRIPELPRRRTVGSFGRRRVRRMDRPGPARDPP